MAKLIVLASLLAALMVVSSVSARTTITTTVVEDDFQNPGKHGGCEEQIRQQDNLNMCLMFLREKTQGGSSSSYFDRLAMVTGRENPQQQEEEFKRGCCRQLENVSEDCRCEGLSMMMKRHQQRGQEMQQMKSMVEKFPSMCNIGPERCQIETALF